MGQKVVLTKFGFLYVKDGTSDDVEELIDPVYGELVNDESEINEEDEYVVCLPVGHDFNGYWSNEWSLFGDEFSLVEE